MNYYFPVYDNRCRGGIFYKDISCMSRIVSFVSNEGQQRTKASGARSTMNQNKIAGRILLIEDDRQLRRLFQKKMAGKGYEIIEAADGKEGMKRFRDIEPDLIITDIVMPEQEGLETISELRKLAPKVKIIAISGGGRVGPDSYLNTAKFLGADCIFPKPIAWPELFTAIEALLQAP